ncbi:hypothetical protein J5N97_011812 [Dioscorea zingiberensis]|uniref:Uncharacterized protein n=1 Tax=Dioscorea zingiberensis TaxID=325984 RepID=A0A9D5D337_9LILI|nr:hypothetical protein J5N97_011812 [Dioscorea zingiberensis]
MGQEGDQRHLDHVPIACKDAVAILIMFDLTSRSTLNNAINWYRRGRKWNKTAIPVLIGTKFDDFVQLPLEMQWTVVNELVVGVGSQVNFVTLHKHGQHVHACFSHLWTLHQHLFTTAE